MVYKKTVALVVLAVIFFIIYTQVTVFVIQPIGALPEGKTLVIARSGKTEFIDSADAVCQRLQGKVNLLCRGMVIGAIVDESKILLRLPYSSWLYDLSTGGKRYDR